VKTAPELLLTIIGDGRTTRKKNKYPKGIKVPKNEIYIYRVLGPPAESRYVPWKRGRLDYTLNRGQRLTPNGDRSQITIVFPSGHRQIERRSVRAVFGSIENSERRNTSPHPLPPVLGVIYTLDMYVSKCTRTRYVFKDRRPTISLTFIDRCSRVRTP